jgi:ubiquitin-protein ligase
MEISNHANEIREIIKNSDFKLKSFVIEEDKYIIDLDTVKIITDLNVFCYCDSPNLNLLFLNTEIKSINYIFNKLIAFKSTEEKTVKSIPDRWHIYEKINTFSKVLLNYEYLETQSKKFRELKNVYNLSVFPADLLFNTNQIFQILKNEIKSINENAKYKHYIEPINNNIYELSLKLNLKIPTEIKITIEPKVYPFIPPKFEFIKPFVKLPLASSLMNLKILKSENWIPTTSLEWIIIELADKLEPIIQDYIVIKESTDLNLESLLYSLALFTNEANGEELIKIELPKVNKQLAHGSNSKYWSAGTGYGHSGLKSINVAELLKKQENISEKLLNILSSIYKNISSKSSFNSILPSFISNKITTKSNFDTISDSILPSFLIRQISGLTLMELGKNEKLYEEILKMLECIITFALTDKLQNFINNISGAFTSIVDELGFIKTLKIADSSTELQAKIISIAETYKSRTINTLSKTIVISDNIQKEYEEFMKIKQFGTFDIPKHHRYLNELNIKLNPTATKKVMLEITNFRKNLPVNWGSTIFVRISQKNLNLFSFWITGPKDTPYENMIMEFHASYPENYPNTFPKVLLHTTGNDTVRFNPNLYKEGKVCLSALGTWGGDESESWNPLLSTMYQVICSVQAQILGMDEPYFNEPGYEKSRHTPEGIRNSQEYNENLYPESIRWGIVDMIKNPPETMEEVIKTHFKMKKDEIVETTGKWLTKIDNKITKYTNDINILGQSKQKSAIIEEILKKAKLNRENLNIIRNEMIELFSGL